MTVRIKLETRNALDAIAAAYVETHRWQVEHIQQGLHEADAGKFASDADVKRVMRRRRRK